MPRIQPDGPVRRVPIAGYTLAASWSPEYCRLRAGRASDRRQCSGRDGRFGFVLHGLWPEGRGGQWPQWCAATQPLTARELARNMCMTPSARLLAHEWAKHGTCMTRSPEGYFGAARALWNSLRWPDLDRLSQHRTLSAGELRQAIADANPGWGPRSIGVHLSGRGWLQELRLCYDRRFMPATCDARRRGAADNHQVEVWRGL